MLTIKGVGVRGALAALPPVRFLDFARNIQDIAFNGIVIAKS